MLTPIQGFIHLLTLRYLCHNSMVHTGGESLQSWLRDVQTCEMTLALAYILCCLTAI